jgi:hypothetical protein
MVVPPEVEEIIAALMRRIEALEADNAKLRRRLGLDSSNSRFARDDGFSVRLLRRRSDFNGRPVLS